MSSEQDKSPFTSDEVRARYAKVEPDNDIVEAIVEALDSRVFGQHDACAAVARRVAIAESPFVDPQRPLASVFLMGPTGTGKTEMSRALAEHLFEESWEERLLVVDCTQFAHEVDVSRFIGSSPQYVGYGDKGIITKEFLEQGPNIIVFDEVEKAHPAVWELLLRVLDKGKMMVRAGSKERDHANEEELFFHDSYIFFTSNVGAAQIGEIQQLLAGGTIAGETASERIKLAANDALKKLFKPMPEFLGRLDDIVVFQPLGDKQYRRIFDKVMGEINQQLEDKPGTPQLSYTHEFRDYVLSLVNKEYGAREIRRWIDREFIEPAVDIASSKDLENTMLIADFQHGKKAFYRKPLEAHEQPSHKHPKKEEKETSQKSAKDKAIIKGTEEYNMEIERAKAIIAGITSKNDAVRMETIEKFNLRHPSWLYPEDAEATIDEGPMDYPAELSVEEEVIDEGPMAERAREILGKDFLGVEAVRTLEKKLKAIGKNVEFDFEGLPPIPYTERDLQVAKELGEMLVVRPETMFRDGKEIPLTLIELKALFDKDPLRNLIQVFKPKMGDWTGGPQWYEKEKFATQPVDIKLKWALVKKDGLSAGDQYHSKCGQWDAQEQSLRQYEVDLRKRGAEHAFVHRRTATEAVFDSLLYYVNTGERLLRSKFDCCKTLQSGGDFVSVGDFDSMSGIGVAFFKKYTDSLMWNEYLIACPSR
jgi:DNA polymerase III delta prime subunit